MEGLGAGIVIGLSLLWQLALWITLPTIVIAIVVFLVHTGGTAVEHRVVRALDARDARRD